MLSSVEQAFVGRDEKRAPLKTPAWEASGERVGLAVRNVSIRNLEVPGPSMTTRWINLQVRFSSTPRPRL